MAQAQAGRQWYNQLRHLRGRQEQAAGATSLPVTICADAVYDA